MPGFHLSLLQATNLVEAGGQSAPFAPRRKVQTADMAGWMLARVWYVLLEVAWSQTGH